MVKHTYYTGPCENITVWHEGYGDSNGFIVMVYLIIEREARKFLLDKIQLITLLSTYFRLTPIYFLILTSSKNKPTRTVWNVRPPLLLPVYCILITVRLNYCGFQSFWKRYWCVWDINIIIIHGCFMIMTN